MTFLFFSLYLCKLHSYSQYTKGWIFIFHFWKKCQCENFPHRKWVQLSGGFVPIEGKKSGKRIEYFFVRRGSILTRFINIGSNAMYWKVAHFSVKMTKEWKLKMEKDRVEIKLNSPDNTYFSGQEISGQICFFLTKKTKIRGKLCKLAKMGTRGMAKIRPLFRKILVLL